MAQMTEERLGTILSQEIQSAKDEITSGEISRDRRKAIAYYNGAPFGTEKAGRSSVVSRDVLETIESMLPSLMRIFTSGAVVGKFKPRTQADDEVAKQATDYVDVVFSQDNPGFLNLYTMFKDALMLKTGILKHWWEEKEEVNQQVYTGLSEIGLEALRSENKGDDIEIVVEEEDTKDVVVVDGQPIELVTFRATVKRTVVVSNVRIMPLEPEDFLASDDARLDDIEGGRYWGHQTRKTQSELIAEGFEKSLIKDLPSFSEDTDSDEDQERDRDKPSTQDKQVRNDDALRKILITESYILVDFDDDGIAERRKVISAGNGSAVVILSNELSDSVPFSVVVPYPAPHRLIGKSVADLVTDIQRIKSTLLRQMIDNLYQVNNPRKEVVENQVNVNDLLTGSVGGVVRVKQPGMLREIVTPFVAASAFPMLQYFDDAVKAGRTGVSKATTGLDPNVLNSQTATAVDGLLGAAQERIEMIARIFAETGIKRAFEEIYKLIVRNMDRERTIRVRGEWVAVDPRTWNSKLDVVVEVGLGNSDDANKRAMLRDMLGIQGDLSGLPAQNMVTPQNVFNATRDLMAVGGIFNIEEYLTNPENTPEVPQDDGPNPAQMKVQLDAQKQEFDQSLKMQDQKFSQELQQQEAQARIALEKLKVANQIQLEEAKARVKASTEIELAQQKAALERDKLKFQATLKAAELEAEIELEQAKINAGLPSGNGIIPG